MSTETGSRNKLTPPNPMGGPWGIKITGVGAAMPDKVLTNETIFDLKDKPDHLIIIGGGPIGMEMAQAHRRLGSAVTSRSTALPISGTWAERKARSVSTSDEQRWTRSPVSAPS